MGDLITVIIPTFNRAHLISGAIESVINQTYKNWELIIIDDASEDDAKQVVENFNDERIRYFKLKINKGNAGARNVGLQKVRGRLITFLDSDDELDALYLKKFVDLFHREPETNFAFGGYKVRDNDTKIVKETFWKPKENVDFLYELKIGTGCGIFFTKKVVEEIGGFDENLRVAVDTDWLIRVNKVFKPEILSEALITINTHSGKRVRDNKKELLKTYEIIVNKNFDEINFDKNLYCKFYYKLMWLNFYDKNYRRGNKIFKQLIGRNAFGARIIGIWVMFNVFPLNVAKKIHKGL